MNGISTRAQRRMAVGLEARVRKEIGAGAHGSVLDVIADMQGITEEARRYIRAARTAYKIDRETFVDAMDALDGCLDAQERYAAEAAIWLELPKLAGAR